MPFDVEKRQHLEKLSRAKAAGEADEAAFPVLDAVNARPDAYTTSSCAGRVQVLALPEPGAKAASVTLGRWHEAPPLDAVVSAYEERPGGLPVWLHAQPPIFHVEARTLEAGEGLRRLAENAGFKHSALRQVRADGTVLVEWASTERLETPVADERMLRFLHPRAVEVFERGRGKLDRLLRALQDPPEA